MGGAARPPQFEHAITLARIAGALVVVLIVPFVPNLGPPFIALLSGTLVTAGIVLHFLATGVRDARDGARLSWWAFGFDTLVVLFAILLLAPDPLWPIIPLIGMLLIITSTFRMGTRGAMLSTVLLMGGVVAIAVWRDRVLGLSAPVAYVAYDLILYCLTAVIVTSMLREIGVLRQERIELIVRAADADTLRDNERLRDELLRREREARTAAEVAVVRLDAVQRISDTVLQHASPEELLPDTLRTLVRIVGAHAGAILTGEGRLTTRAVFGLLRVPRGPIDVRGDVAAALQGDTPLAVRDDSLVALDALTPSDVSWRLLLPVRRTARQSALLYLGFDHEQPLTSDDRTLLARIAERLAIALDHADRLEDERQARDTAESATERATLLAEAVDAVLTEGDVNTRLSRLAHLIAPKLADQCAIDVIRPDGTFERLAVAATSAEGEGQLWMVAHRYPRVLEGSQLRQVIETGAPILIEHVGPDEMRALARGPEHLRLLIERDVRSWAAVPLRRDGQAFGAIQLINTGYRRSLNSDDLATVELVAARAAAAVERGGTMR